jgi:hypothetical protein
LKAAAGDKRKTKLRTFRFSEETIEFLEREAAKADMSVNAFVGSLISRHVEWESKAQEFGFQMLYRPLISSLVEALDNETLDRLGREKVYPMWRDMAEFWFQDTSGEGILRLLTYLSPYVQIQTQVKRERNNYTLDIHHSMGPKWSIVIAGALDEAVKQVFHSRPVVERTSSIVSARFSLPPSNAPI